ncbi:MAG: hypothetical protein HYX78_12520 [Armatimonadetes bacterium]|nr:hypothetical protein [Armatimonadota bacterium]
MSRRIKITAASVEQTAELNETKTADLIWDALPIKASGNTWGDEIYFGIPVDAHPEDSKAVVEMGDLGYWPPGNAFCIFFGPTPASRGDEIRPSSPVNVFGKLEGDPKEFTRVPGGAEVMIEKAE